MKLSDRAITEQFERWQEEENLAALAERNNEVARFRILRARFNCNAMEKRARELATKLTKAVRG